MLHHVMYHSKQWRKRGRIGARQNTYCSFRMMDGAIGFGCIVSFHITSSFPFCFIERLHLPGTTSLTKLRPARNHILQNTETLVQQLINFMPEVNIEATSLIAVPLDHILSKCILVRVPITQRNSYHLITLPNPYELH